MTQITFNALRVVRAANTPSIQQQFVVFLKQEDSCYELH